MNAFTPRAGQVLALSCKEAERFHHSYVGTEHLLLGLIGLGQGVAFHVLQKLGLDLETARFEVEKHVGDEPQTAAKGKIRYTFRAKKVLALSGMEAKALSHTWVGTEHILLGLLRENNSAAARILNGRGVDIETTRKEVYEALKNTPGVPRSRGTLPACLVKPVRKNQRLPILIMSGIVCLLISIAAGLELVRH